MIALPGLTLVTGRFDIARDILRSFAQHVDCGMLPNRFPDAGETPEYNTVDATLWFFEAIRAYTDYSGDFETVRRDLYPTLLDIVDWHVRGTRYSIRVDGDGLLACGEPGVQLTWMDAKVGDWVVTPRCGKPVEVQALWYNALRILEDFARRFEGAAAASRYGEIAERAAASFHEQFWSESTGCLYDTIHGGVHDGSIRPNQVIALSLRHSMVSRERGERILETVRRDLLTPVGLRTLSPFDPRYRGVYEGDPLQRDAAYHQGTVWPWLLGPYLTACRRVYRDSEEARRHALDCLSEFESHLGDAGVGQISEIFDGDFPHRPRGCIAQAWSVGELLRAVVEDACGIRPALASASAAGDCAGRE
jgi:predicted glycogen debranching enzyme